MVNNNQKIVAYEVQFQTVGQPDLDHPTAKCSFRIEQNVKVHCQCPSAIPEYQMRDRASTNSA